MIEASTLRSALLKLGDRPRSTLYINTKRVKSEYDQLGGKDQYSLGGEIGEEVDAGLNWLAKFGIKSSSRRMTSEVKNVSDSPELMALLMEFHLKGEGKLLELPTHQYSDRAWVRFVGDGRILRPHEAVTSKSTNLPTQTVNAIEHERVEQGARWDPPKGYVWTAASKPPLAAIGKGQHANEDEIDSWRKGSFGIFGRFESDKNIVWFITPFWLWV